MAAERSRRAFTLIELLVVVSIIALLISILLPSLGRARQRVKATTCLSNLKQIGAGMTMYTSDFRGWLPVGPADKVWYRAADGATYKKPGPGLRPYPWSNCHWGGRRAGFIHDIDPLHPKPIREKLPRPLTGYVHKGANLDDDTPVFRCPDDKGSDAWDQTKGSTAYAACGNSYYTYPWDEYIDARRRSHKTPSRVVLVTEASMYFDVWQHRRRMGWHDRFSTHNMLFLDYHASTRNVDTTKNYGADWVIENYFEIMDYYAY